jgi:hypothetical protein
MIISHEHEFIYLKTRKTASTSIEIALSEFCGDDDIITPISDKDEAKRRARGFRGPQNFSVPLRFHGKLELLGRLWRGQYIRKRFRNHRSARFVRRHIEDDIWNSYFTFTFERNPFDKAVSRYYWSTDEPRPRIDDYLDAAPIHFLSNWNIYTMNDKKVVDYVGRYENLARELEKITDEIGLPRRLSLPRAKANHRPDRMHYSKVLNERARASASNWSAPKS